MDEIFTNIIDSLNDRNQEQRNAYSSIDGYFYQFELSLFHILIDCTAEEPFDGLYSEGQPSGQTKIETIEDYIKVIDLNNRKLFRVGQIKHHTVDTPPSKYRQAILFLYYGYLKFKALDCSLEYKARIFYCSPNDLTKSVATVLDDAMEEQAQKVTGGDINDPPIPIYNKIINLVQDSTPMRQDFSNCTDFLKTDSRAILKSNIKSKIKEQIPLLRASEEVSFNTALAKVIESGRSGEFITKQTILNDLSNNSESINKDAYLELINGVIKYLTQNRLLKMVENHLEISSLTVDEKDDIFAKYLQISENIFQFVTASFSDNSQYYVSFLRTVIPKDEDFYFNSDFQAGYEIFLKGIDCIYSFIIKLAKIAYSYWVTYNKKPNVIDWFEIDINRWLFKYPEENRDNGIIIGNLNNLAEFNSSLGEIASRYAEDTNRPNVWYYMSDIKNGFCVNYSDPIKYKLDISKVNQDFSMLDVNKDFFFLECLICLDECKCEEINKVANIFKLGCCNET